MAGQDGRLAALSRRERENRRPVSLQVFVPRFAAAVLVGLILTGTQAFACSVPVFRYALDHWQSDSYRLEIDPGAAKEATMSKFLRNFGANSPLNLEPVRLPATPPATTSRLLFPHGADKGLPVVWSGSLDMASLAILTNSPARKEIVRRVLDGESAIWILVESGDREANETAAKALTKRITFLEAAAAIPEIDPNDPDSQLGPGPALRSKFSMLRVRGDDPAEGPFLKMLGGAKQPSLGDGPLMAMIFGRGRVLGIWPAKDMGSEQIDEASLFLLGACSCQAKALNPGWDLLLAVDWDAELQAISQKKRQSAEAPPAGSDANPPATTATVRAPETVTIRAADPVIATASPSNFAKPIVAAVALLLAVAASFAWRNAHSRS